MSLKYVCLSDLHLGAPNSLLTQVESGIERHQIQAAPETAPRTLKEFGKALRAFLPPLCDPKNPPTLILLGDLLDLSFSTPDVAAKAMLRFIEEVFPAGETRLFADRIVLVPGNHDHWLWQAGKSDDFLERTGATPATATPALIETTPMLKEPVIPCRWVTKLFHAYRHLSDISVVLAYPNLGYINDRRAVMLHHGHFIEPIYRMISDLIADLGGGDTTYDVSKLEGANGNWIDFLWSGLSETGGDAYSMYSLMQDGAALRRFGAFLAAKVQKTFMQQLPMSGVLEVQELEVSLTRGLFDALVGKAGDLERNSFQSVLSPGGIAGLKWYFGKLATRQFLAEHGGPRPHDMTFILGHTHKPFEDLLAVEGYRSPVKVFNLGGWALDVPQMVATQGGAMVLIDDQLQVASVRLFNDPVNNVLHDVDARGVSGYPDETNALLGELVARFKKEPGLWRAFSDAVQGDIANRSRLIQAQFYHAAMSAPPGS